MSQIIISQEEERIARRHDGHRTSDITTIEQAPHIVIRCFDCGVEFSGGIKVDDYSRGEGWQRSR